MANLNLFDFFQKHKLIRKKINTNVWILFKLCLSFTVTAEFTKTKEKKTRQDSSACKKLFNHVYVIEEI